ncbi:NAD(P)H-dependent oxidoreductase [Brucella sp. BE17]|uniref:FMN-dependent NADH-azoreductase n=1 Tax=Brucella sp. BE17 TaxID=3142977 RepID=UPI0031BBBFE2
MCQILVVNSSVSGDASISRNLVDHDVHRLLEAEPDSNIVHRNLSYGPIPHLTPATAAGVRAIANTPDELATQALSDELIEELRVADVIVFGVPMYNWSLPTPLRVWFDHVIRPSVTFVYDEDGPKGLLIGKRVIAIEARGGVYTEGPNKSIDFQKPYLRQLLSFIGITEVVFAHAERIGYGPQAREAAITAAKSQIDGIVTRLASLVVEAAPIELAADFDAIMQASLSRVFGERDPARRLEAIRELYAADALLNEQDQSVEDHAAISQAVTDLLDHMPPISVFGPFDPRSGTTVLAVFSGLEDRPMALLQ